MVESLNPTKDVNLSDFEDNFDWRDEGALLLFRDIVLANTSAIMSYQKEIAKLREKIKEQEELSMRFSSNLKLLLRIHQEYLKSVGQEGEETSLNLIDSEGEVVTIINYDTESNKVRIKEIDLTIPVSPK